MSRQTVRRLWAALLVSGIVAVFAALGLGLGAIWSDGDVVGRLSDTAALLGIYAFVAIVVGGLAVADS